MAFSHLCACNTPGLYLQLDFLTIACFNIVVIRHYFNHQLSFQLERALSSILFKSCLNLFTCPCTWRSRHACKEYQNPTCQGLSSVRESLDILMIEIGEMAIWRFILLRAWREILLKLETLPVIGHNCVLHWGFIVKPTEIQFDKKTTGALFCKLCEVHSVNEVRCETWGIQVSPNSPSLPPNPHQTRALPVCTCAFVSF